MCGMIISTEHILAKHLSIPSGLKWDMQSDFLRQLLVWKERGPDESVSSGPWVAQLLSLVNFIYSSLKLAEIVF